MLVLSLGLQSPDWLGWLDRNWTVLVILLGMIGFLALLVVLARAPESPEEKAGPHRPGDRDRSRDSEDDPSVKS